MRFRPIDDATRLVQYELSARPTLWKLSLASTVDYGSVRSDVGAMIVEREAIVDWQFLRSKPKSF